MKKEVSGMDDIAEIIKNPKAYKVYTKHASAYMFLGDKLLRKMSINEIESRIDQKQLFYELLH